MRTFARHFAGTLVGLFSAALVAWLLDLGLTQAEAASFIEHLTGLLSVAILLAGYWFTEKGLKGLKSLFPDAWAEKIWKDHAGEVVDSMDEEAAKVAIEEGRV